MEMFLLGRRLSADEALAAGLVNRLAEPAALEETARGCAEAIAALPPRAVEETRRLVDAAPEALGARVDRELAAFADLLGDERTRETLAAVRARIGGR